MVRIHLKKLTFKSMILLKRLGVLLLCFSLLLFPNPSYAEALLDVQKDYNNSICNKDSTVEQAKAYCETAKDSLYAADLMVFTTAFYGAVVAVCIPACGNVSVMIPVCMAADIGATIADLGVTAKVSENFANEMMTVIPAIAGAAGGAYGIYQWNQGRKAQNAAKAQEKASSEQKAAAEERTQTLDDSEALKGESSTDPETSTKANESQAASDEASKAGKTEKVANAGEEAGKAADAGADAGKAGKGAAKKSKFDTGSCFALALASAMLIQKSLSTVQTIKKAKDAIEEAEKLKGDNPTVAVTDAGAVKNQSQALGGKSGAPGPAGGNSTPVDLNTANDPQRAAAEASNLGIALPPASISGPFAKAFQDALGTPYKDFMTQNRSNAEANAMNALASALPADAMKKVSALSDDYKAKLSSMNMGNVANTTYSGGGGRGRSGGGGEDDAMAQMISGMMSKFGGMGQGQDATTEGGTNVLMFSGAKASLPSGISLNKNDNLFELISIRYSKLEKRMF